MQGRLPDLHPGTLRRHADTCSIPAGYTLSYAYLGMVHNDIQTLWWSQPYRLSMLGGARTVLCCTSQRTIRKANGPLYRFMTSFDTHPPVRAASLAATV
jgi:hypothetical protein